MPSGQKRSYTKISCKFRARVTGKAVCISCWASSPLCFYKSLLLSSSSETIQSLHTELDSVQALRAQLEDVLGRTRSMTLELERVAKRQPDYGGGDGQMSPASGVVGDRCH